MKTDPPPTWQEQNQATLALAAAVKCGPEQPYRPPEEVRAMAEQLAGQVPVIVEENARRAECLIAVDAKATLAENTMIAYRVTAIGLGSTQGLERQAVDSMARLALKVVETGRRTLLTDDPDALTDAALMVTPNVARNIARAVGQPVEPPKNTTDTDLDLVATLMEHNTQLSKTLLKMREERDVMMALACTFGASAGAGDEFMMLQKLALATCRKLRYERPDINDEDLGIELLTTLNVVWPKCPPPGREGGGD